jgi:glutathione S-transferase
MNQHKIELFGIPQSNFVRAVRIICEEKSIRYDYFPVNPHSIEADQIHPLGKIPGLRHGDVKLGESVAIVAYLDSLYPEKPMATAASSSQAGVVEQWISIVMTAVDPIFIRQYAFAYLFPETADGAVDRDAVNAALPKLKALIEMLDGALAGMDFLAAGCFTFADALLLSTLAAVQLFPEGRSALENAQNLARYVQLHSSRNSLIATDPWQDLQTGAAA